MDDKGAQPVDALVIGAGPAGIMAAERLAAAGRRVTIAEGKPSAGRKFLMAGKSGLNLTKDEPLPDFVAAYGAASDWLAPMIARMTPKDVTAFANGLGQTVFTGSSGRVFPMVMKASPLLRAWLQRVPADMRLNWQWTGADGPIWRFSTPEGGRSLRPGVVVLALGGASWSRLGSDGAWTAHLTARGIPLAPFKPANMGFAMRWTAHMRPFFGMPVKPVALRAGDGPWLRGEFILSESGVEGGGIYAVSAAVRDGADLRIDLLPDLSVEETAARLARRPAKRKLAKHLSGALGLSPVKLALLQEVARPLPTGPDLAPILKALTLPHAGPRPMDQAISTAGGVPRVALTQALMLRDWPGVFCAGEMLDWEAPTGGYLITGCLATGAWAGDHAARWP